MSLYKLGLPPSQDNYSVTFGNEVVAIQLDGGKPRLRKDQANSSARVTCSWTVDPVGYQYLQAFYRYVTQSGALPFLIDLIINLPTVQEYEATFVPNTFRTTGQSGLAYVVEAELDVPLKSDDASLIKQVLRNYDSVMKLEPAWCAYIPQNNQGTISGPSGTYSRLNELFKADDYVFVEDAYFTYSSATYSLNGLYQVGWIDWSYLPGTIGFEGITTVNPDWAVLDNFQYDGNTLTTVKLSKVTADFKFIIGEADIEFVNPCYIRRSGSSIDFTTKFSANDVIKVKNASFVLNGTNHRLDGEYRITDITASQITLDVGNNPMWEALWYANSSTHTTGYISPTLTKE